MVDDAWPEAELNSLFRINRDQVLPSLNADSTFVHYSIPAWDEFGGPVKEAGKSIESNKTAISSPSVLVSKLNPRKPRVVVVPSVGANTCCSTEFICYQPKSLQECLPFWGAYFSSGKFARRLERVSVGSTNSHTRANPAETLRWMVRNPSSLEKEAIASILDTLDTAIRQTEAIIEKLKEVKQGLLHDLLTRGFDENGELRPPQSEAPHLYKKSPLGWIPNEWRHATVEGLMTDRTLLDVQDGNHGELHPKRDDFVSEGIPFLMAKDLVGGRIDFSDCYRISLAQYERLRIGFATAQDVLISHKGTIGETAIVPDGHSRVMLTPQVTYYRVDAQRLMPEYLLAWMRYSSFQQRMKVLGAQSTRDYIGITVQKKSLFILVPAVRAEQQKIARIAGDLEVRTERERSNARKLLLLRRGLMDDLLTGRVRVTPLLKE